MKRFYFIRILERHEMIIWLGSMLVLIVAFLLSGQDYLNLFTSLVGVTALIYLAKGEPLGQILSVIFSLIYALVAFTFRYYGEMLTYLALTLPSSLFATFIWLKNPHHHGQSTVKVAALTKKKILLVLALAPVITLIFYPLLAYFNTPHLLISTLSITTSFIAAMFTFFRSRFYALAYALNDIILILLWTLATSANLTYLPMVVCFVVFLLNDLYAFFNWKRLETKQSLSPSSKEKSMIK